MTGPTAVGKTDMAIQLARLYQTEIISCDSRQFYRGLDIGTAKPEMQELASVKHHFINNKEPNELFGAGDFAREAKLLLDALFLKNKIVIMAGGSGMYIDALVNGVDEFEDVPSEFRERLNAEFEKNGLEFIQEKLRNADPVYFEKVDRNNPQRMIRALEVCEYTGKPYSSFLSKSRSVNQFVPIFILLNMDREKLYNRINERVEKMMEKGLLEEVKNLVPYRNHNALKTVGYKELFEYLDGKCSLQEAVNAIKQHTRNYAKRQLTWFRNKNESETFDPSEIEKIKAYLELIIKHG
ncbi:MAG TPA: tRNA (adenosine(37)-N6)-dimethylallyltransferase MiaA [Bacteroidia bacterium]|nr:tRNA (adenosine(37)-N6)-dimethylallyltransferase MiaA [Bacteroidia bacterium]